MKPLIWVGSSLDDLKALPEDVRRGMGYGLYLAQMGKKHPNAKPLKGFGGAGVLETMEDFAGGTQRVIYTVKLSDAVYVLHASKRSLGAAWPHPSVISK